jgi:CRISPR-associated protein Cas5d
LDYGLTFHGFDYPDETGTPLLRARFWRPVMEHGVIHFPYPDQCDIRKDIRPMEAKQFGNSRVRSVDLEASDLEL